MNEIDEKPIKDALTLTREKMHNIASERIAEIVKEFTQGFKFLEDFPKSITFFGANQFSPDNPYYQSAQILSGRLVKELGYTIVSGGGPGIMEAANRGAFEAGGNSIGLLIKLPHEQKINHYVTKTFPSYYFFVRKVLLTFSAEAFIFYPGGYGTLDEFFEILTLIQTKKISNIPVICVGSEYWNKLKKFIIDEMLARKTVNEEESELFQIVDDHDKIIEIIKKVPVRMVVPFNQTDTVLRDKTTGPSS